MAVERADDRQVHVEQVPDQLLAVAPEQLERARFLQLREPSEVATGRERPAPPGEQHGACLGLPLQVREQVGEVLVQVAVDAVEVVALPIDRDAQHIAVALELEMLEVTHASTPRHRRHPKTTRGGAEAPSPSVRRVLDVGHPRCVAARRKVM